MRRDFLAGLEATNQPSPQSRDRDPPLFPAVVEVSKQEWTRGRGWELVPLPSNQDRPGDKSWTSLSLRDEYLLPGFVSAPAQQCVCLSAAP